MMKKEMKERIHRFKPEDLDRCVRIDMTLEQSSETVCMTALGRTMKL